MALAKKPKAKVIKTVEPRFLNANDVNLRLDGGVGLYEEMPCVIYAATTDFNQTQVRIHELGAETDQGILVDANDSRLFTKTLEVGYMNSWQNIEYNVEEQKWRKKRVAYFVTRGTNRKQKSVLHPSNTYITTCGKTATHQMNGMMFSGDFRDMLLNEYPKTRDFSFLETGESWAISRNFAILQQAKQQKLFFNGHEIGKRTPSETHFSLEPGYDHSIMVMRLADLSLPV